MQGLTFEEMNNWRLEISAQLNLMDNCKDIKLKVFNPVDFYNFEKNNYKSEDEIMDFDLQHATGSDFLIVNLENLNSSTGTTIEIDRCHQKGITILAFGSKENEKTLHPWLKRMIRRIENTDSELCDYIRDFVLI